MGRAPQPGTSWICGAHNRLSVPAWWNGEKRMRHAGPGDRDWCFCKRFTERVVREVDRETALAALGNAGEDGEHAGHPL